MNAIGNLENFLQVVIRGCRSFLMLAILRIPPYKSAVVFADRLSYPADIDRDNDDKQRQPEHQMHGLENVDNFLFGATIEVVDVEHDAFNERHLRARRLAERITDLSKNFRARLLAILPINLHEIVER